MLRMNAMTSLLAVALCLGAISQAHAAVDFGAIERIALERVPGQVEEIQRKHGVFEVEVRAKDGVKYELRIDPEKGTILNVRVDH